MVFLDHAKNQLTLLMGGSTTGSVGQILIGTGSATISASRTELTTANDRQTVTSITFPAQKKVSWQFDWNSLEISGTILSEFGLIKSGGGLTGSLHSLNVMPNLTFDGTNELRIEFNGEVF
ncbi:MAG: hypothetical protein IIA87_03730 [Nanoarchaeota archaeon]|nr:hypothetical protein [Nanoarchaeota archaeon]